MRPTVAGEIDTLDLRVMVALVAKPKQHKRAYLYWYRYSCLYGNDRVVLYRGDVPFFNTDKAIKVFDRYVARVWPNTPRTEIIDCLEDRLVAEYGIYDPSDPNAPPQTGDTDEPK